MRIGTHEDRPCVVMWVGDQSLINDIIPSDFSVLVRRLKIGKGCLKRNLLKQGCTGRDFNGDNTTRKSCIGIYLDDNSWRGLLKERFMTRESLSMC